MATAWASMPLAVIENWGPGRIVFPKVSAQEYSPCFKNTNFGTTKKISRADLAAADKSSCNGAIFSIYHFCGYDHFRGISQSVGICKRQCSWRCAKTTCALETPCCVHGSLLLVDADGSCADPRESDHTITQKLPAKNTVPWQCCHH